MYAQLNDNYHLLEVFCSVLIFVCSPVLELMHQSLKAFMLFCWCVRFMQSSSFMLSLMVISSCNCFLNLPKIVLVLISTLRKGSDNTEKLLARNVRFVLQPRCLPYRLTDRL